MQKIQLPHVILPTEFTTLLKSNLSITTSASPIFEVIRNNPSLVNVLEKAFSEFNDGRGLEKTILALTWPNFRDRMASIYIYKAIFGAYPKKTNMELVEDIQRFEQRFVSHGVHSFSRLFLLGFYIRLAGIETQRQNNKFFEFTIPDELERILRISEGRSEKIDWLILITMHFLNAIGEKMLMNSMASGKKFQDIYNLLTPELKKNMSDNLLAYGASIGESDLFLYEKV